MFVSKSIVQTLMREDEFGTFAQNVRKMSSRTRFVNNYFHVTHLRLLALLPPSLRTLARAFFPSDNSIPCCCTVLDPVHYFSTPLHRRKYLRSSRFD
jgi:hypothetical protein